MAKNNAGDILTGDWNPVVGCNKFSPGCRKCWWLDGILPWQQRLGNLPNNLLPNQSIVINQRMTIESLKPKKGIVGVIQHGDLFWDKVNDATITQVLDIVDEVAAIKKKKGDPTKYILWSKRAKRMAEFMTQRYPSGVPEYLACGISIENQGLADERLPHLLRVKGHRFVMIEPMLGPIDLDKFLDVNWVVLGSETGGDDARPMDLDWARTVRDQVVPRKIPFFVKQVGNNHRNPNRKLDGRTWDEFPEGFTK